MRPKRIQMSRRKGWKKPAGTIYVGRPTAWGNPFKMGPTLSAAEAVAKFERHLAGLPGSERKPLLAPLRGKNLACWCALDEPCHADVLLEWANK